MRAFEAGFGGGVFAMRWDAVFCLGVERGQNVGFLWLPGGLVLFCLLFLL
jgi:hypothetical protein